MSNDEVPPSGQAPSSDEPSEQVDSAVPPAPAQPVTPDTGYQWPAPDQTTQVVDPDAQQTAVYPQQAAYPTDQQTTALPQAQQTTAYPQYQGYDYGQQPASETQQQWPAAGADGYLPPPPGVTPQTGQPAAPKSTGVGKFIAIAALTGLLAGVGGGAVGYELAQGSGSTSTVTVNSPNNPEGLSVRADGSIASIAQTVLPSVVSLEVSGNGQSGSGSGFILSQDGYILTNNHVIEAAVDSGSIDVVLQDGTRATGELIGRNADYDLAVVKIDKTGLTPVSVGDSGSVKVGDQAIAIGSPLGLEGTVTSGIVSSLDRPVTAGGADGSETSFINAIQTDAPINPGNSGGPLVNAEGQVIGVNSAIASLNTGASGQAGSIGLGFAIPINTANRIAQELIKTGTAATPIIGAEIDFSYSGQGAKVQTVTPGGPADQAGLKDGDVVVAVNGQRVDDAVSLITDIRKNAPGDKITLTLDNGDEIEVTLGQR